MPNGLSLDRCRRPLAAAAAARRLPAPRLILAAALAAVALLAAPALAAKAPVNQSRRGVALEGYDAVAYFADGAPVEGSGDFTHSWNGAEWRFKSAQHRDRFAADPEAYAPQYGGYCAYAVSQGKTASIDPEAWSIVDGKLYLNYSKSIQKKWQADVPGYIAAADRNWPGVLE